MTREEADFIGAMNMCDEISDEAYKKIMCHCEEQQPCEDAISREAMLKYQQYLHGKMPNEENHKLWEFIKGLPSVTPKQKTGKWIDTRCSECGREVPAYIFDWKWQKDMDAKFCPHCGQALDWRL